MYSLTLTSKVWKVDKAIVGDLFVLIVYSMTLLAKVWKVDEAIVGQLIGHVDNLLHMYRTCTL
jgi:hypothetical protein